MEVVEAVVAGAGLDTSPDECLLPVSFVYVVVLVCVARGLLVSSWFFFADIFALFAMMSHFPLLVF